MNPPHTLLQVGVKIALRNHSGQYLLVRRSPEKYPDVQDSWDIVGGRIVPGTPLSDNIIREIKEETGLDYEGSPRLIAAQDILRTPGKHVVRLTYTGELDGTPKLSDEGLEYRWLTLTELQTLEGLDQYFKAALALLKS